MTKANYNIVIPARYASSRLPGKPLQDIHGKPMIQWVYERCQQSQADQIVVATDSEQVVQACHDFGATVCMTRVDHPSGTDRIEEVCQIFQWPEESVVVNVQGDEPLIPPAIIDQVAENLINHPEAQMSTLSEAIHEESVLFDPNAVKVVTDIHGMALYFSRATIPWFRDGFSEQPRQQPKQFVYQRHIGIYGYRVSLLRRFVTWPPAPIEQVECLEQLRALYQGMKIHVEEVAEPPFAGVDTPADLEKVRQVITDLGLI